MSVHDKELNNFYVSRVFIISVRVLLIAALLASLTIVLSYEGAFGSMSGNAGLAADVMQAASVHGRAGSEGGTVGIGGESGESGKNGAGGIDSAGGVDGDGVPDGSEARRSAPAVVILPDMLAAAKMLDGVASVVSFLNGTETIIEENADIPAAATASAAPVGEVDAIAAFISDSSALETDAPTSGVADIIDPAAPAGGVNNSAPAGFPGDSVYPDNLAEYSFTAINTFFSSMYELSTDVSLEHRERLDARADSIAYARQLAAAKFLSQSAYRIELAKRQEFIDAHGMSAADMSDKDISALYDSNYFTERLRAMGFYKEDKYSADVNRRNSIIRAQSAFNIPITAKIDLNTKRALIEGTDYVPKDIITGEHPDGMWVTIDKSARILTVYIDDAVFKKYPVAVGATIALTPEGQFTFVSKAVNPRWGGGGYASPVAGGAPNNPLGKRWMGLSKGGGGSYGVHGNVSPYSIGTNASHGCVRMINSDVEELYEYITIGTPVWIGTTAKLEEWGIYQQLGSWEPDRPNFWDYLPQSLLYEE